MEEYIYKIGIRRKVPYLISGPEYIVTDNTDYRVELSPDEEWDDFPAKSFIYAFDNGKTVVDPVTGNTDAMPMVPGNAGKLHFGVSAGEMHTTTWVTIPVRGSVRRKGGVEVPPPTPDQYDKIMDMLNKVMGQVGGGKYPVEIFTEPASFDLDGNITYQVVMVLSDKTRLTAKLPSMGLTLTDVTQYGTTDPTSNTAGMTRQFYVNTVTGEMWTCTDGGEQSTTEWRKLGRKMVLSGSKDPTKEVVEGEVDQLYVNTDTGAVYICTFASNGPMWYEWEWQQIVGSGGSGDVGTDITLGITGAVVGRTVKITGVDENGKPTKWEAVDMASGGASSWNDLTDKPFGSGIGKLDIIPEQQVTFSGGVAQLTSWKDPCYDLGLVSNPGTMTAILDINGEIIESELKYNYVASGTFGAYAVQLGAGTIKLGDGATVSDGETATVRMYVMSEIVETLDPKFLPENAAMAVSYSRNQTLTESEQTIVRSNIGAKQTFIWSVLGGGLSTFITTEGFVTEYKEKINILACDFIAVKMNLCTDTSTNKICSADIFVRMEVEVPMCASAMFYTGSEFIEAKFKISISKENRTITIKLLQDIEGYRIQFDGLDLVIFEKSY